LRATADGAAELVDDWRLEHRPCHDRPVLEAGKVREEQRESTRLLRPTRLRFSGMADALRHAGACPAATASALLT
jgi:hypothetical protein